MRWSHHSLLAAALVAPRPAAARANRTTAAAPPTRRGHDDPRLARVTPTHSARWSSGSESNAAPRSLSSARIRRVAEVSKRTRSDGDGRKEDERRRRRRRTGRCRWIPGGDGSKPDAIDVPSGLDPKRARARPRRHHPGESRVVRVRLGRTRPVRFLSVASKGA